MDDATRAAVVQEALTWLGTPYHHHARVKGVGVDCAQQLCAVYEACGCVPHIDPGNYAHDWHLHRGEEVFIGWLEKAGAREEPLQGRQARFWSVGAARSCPVQLGCYADLSVKMRGCIRHGARVGCRLGATCTVAGAKLDNHLCRQ
jgi:hypothetical protein